MGLFDAAVKPGQKTSFDFGAGGVLEYLDKGLVDGTVGPSNITDLFRANKIDRPTYDKYIYAASHGGKFKDGDVAKKPVAAPDATGGSSFIGDLFKSMGF